jgi:hypothetical protein
MSDGDRNNLLGFHRQRAGGEDLLAQSVERRRNLGRELATF